MTVKVESSKPVVFLLAAIALLLLLNLAKSYISVPALYAEFNNDSFETDSRNLEKIATACNSIARQLENINGTLDEIKREIDR
ncbi:hypothetical protein JW890_09265 [candidate division WOR-3 bacterium]|nr:hypothetical protein [candidate division WOR-3 bacterium]